MIITPPGGIAIMQVRWFVCWSVTLVMISQKLHKSDFHELTFERFKSKLMQGQNGHSENLQIIVISN